MKKIFLLLICLNFSCFVFAEENYTNEQIAKAIFLAEGDYQATYLYGIRSVKYKNETDARRICLNTIKNNRIRYKQYGYKRYKDYLSFLASRYAPLQAKNDPQGLNRFWLKNVKWFLKKGEKSEKE